MAPIQNTQLLRPRSIFCKNGPSFMRRHLSLWLSVHVQRAITVLVTGIAIGLPLLHFVPQSFNWMTRRRLFYWYAQLKALERSFDSSTNHKHLISELAEIERIEDAVSKIHFPLKFSDQVHTLRSHIDIGERLHLAYATPDESPLDITMSA